MGEFRKISVGKIKLGTVALREVDTADPEYLSMKESIRKEGVLQSIVVADTSTEAGEEYLLIEGRHRVTACQELGIQEIPANVTTDSSELKVLSLQMQSNAVRKETRPADYADHINRMIALQPGYTLPMLAADLNKPVGWLSNIAKISNLLPEIKEQVNNGTIGVMNAINLAKLPKEIQPEWVERAITDEAGKFGEECNARVREVKQAVRSGKSAPSETFVPIPRVRKQGEIKQELAEGTVGTAICKTEKERAAFAAAIKWACQMDEASVADGQAKFDEGLRIKAEKAAAAARVVAQKAAAVADAAAAELVAKQGAVA